MVEKWEVGKKYRNILSRKVHECTFITRDGFPVLETPELSFVYSSPRKYWKYWEEYTPKKIKKKGWVILYRDSWTELSISYSVIRSKKEADRKFKESLSRDKLAVAELEWEEEVLE